MWDRLQIRKAEETLTLVNRFIRNTEIQPPLIEKITGTRMANTAVPANFKELQGAVDAGRMHELDAKSTVKQALWGLAGELGIVKVPENADKRGKFKNDRGSIGRPRRRRDGDTGGRATTEEAR
jgi:pilus assembly protein CpaE